MPDIRDTLFGDLPVDAWPPGKTADAEPWFSFVAARDALAKGHTAPAIDAWLRIANTPGLESRHYAQSWHFLRARGVPVPADRAKQLLGVVIEVPLNGGLDLLAAYPERTARFYSHAGGGQIWERPDASLDPLIDAVLREGQLILNVIGPWEKERPPAPPAESIRINLLSPAGLHFGQGPFAFMAKDARAKPMIDAATALMVALVNLR